MCGKSLQGSTIGILGLGRIGLSVAKKLLPFEPAKLIYYNRSEQDGQRTTLNYFILFYFNMNTFQIEQDTFLFNEDVFHIKKAFKLINMENCLCEWECILV